MGCRCSVGHCMESSEEREQRDIRKKINGSISTGSEDNGRLHHLLILGLQGSGKTTLLNQLRLLKRVKFSDEEKIANKLEIKRYLRDVILIILNAMNTLQLSLEVNEANEGNAEYFLRESRGFVEEAHFNDKFFDAAESLWNDDAVQMCYNRREEYQLMGHAKYFLDKMSTIRKNDYIPSDQDMLRCNFCSRAILEIKIQIAYISLHIVKVGGHRSQFSRMMKWITYFSGVSAIVFLVACDSYDVMDRDKPCRNRLKEALDMYENIWNNKWLSTTSVILLLNKQEALLDKIIESKSKLETYFPEFSAYEVPQDVSESPNLNEDIKFTKAKHFIRDQFLKISATNGGTHYCYPHFKFLMDPMARVILNDCRDIYQRKSLEKYQLL